MDAVLEKAREDVTSKKYGAAEEGYKKILAQPQEANPKQIALQESAILELGKLYKTNSQIDKLTALIKQSREIMGSFSKSKTAKIIKNLIDYYNDLPNSSKDQIDTTKDCIEWAVESKLIFLRQTLQLKLASLFYNVANYKESIKLINSLLTEYKKLDDKSSLVEVFLLESKNYHQLRNLAKSRAALTSARTSANSIYCPTLVQAELDCMSGILNAEDKDYKTAYSYFYESFENFNSGNDERSIKVLKYMFLCKIMLNAIDDINLLLKNSKFLKYQSKEIDAMKSIALAYQNRSLKEFESSLLIFKKELKFDSIIRSHFTSLYDNLFEKNLLKIIEPFSCVEIHHIANIINLDQKQVEAKLSQMILDKVFWGVLDQGNGYLFIYDKPREDATYMASLSLIKNLNNVVDLLYEKASSLN